MLKPNEAVSVCPHPQLAILAGVEAARTDSSRRGLKAVLDGTIQAYARNNPDTTLRVFIGSKCRRSGNLVRMQPGERAAAETHDAGFRAIPHCSSAVLEHVEDLIVMHAQADRQTWMFDNPVAVPLDESPSSDKEQVTIQCFRNSVD